jgi:hypothetical protein
LGCGTLRAIPVGKGFEGVGAPVIRSGTAVQRDTVGGVTAIEQYVLELQKADETQVAFTRQVSGMPRSASRASSGS